MSTPFVQRRVGVFDVMTVAHVGAGVLGAALGVKPWVFGAFGAATTIYEAAVEHIRESDANIAADAGALLLSYALTSWLLDRSP